MSREYTHVVDMPIPEDTTGEIADFEIVFTVDPGRPAGRIDPPEAPSAEIQNIVMLKGEERVDIDMPLYTKVLDALGDIEDDLLSAAREAEETSALESADHARDLEMDL